MPANQSITQNTPTSSTSFSTIVGIVIPANHLISATPFVLIRVLGVATEYYGYLFAFGVIGYLGGTLICRRLVGKFDATRILALGTSIGLVGGLGFLALVLAGVHHWMLVVIAQFVVMMGHGVNFPCTQSGSLAPFPQKVGAAAGLYGCMTMYAALAAGTWVGSSHDGTLLPLAKTSATVAVMLFCSARILARFAKAA